MKDIHQIFDVASGGGSNHDPYLILDIGCNKGYTSADFFDALSPGTNINPRTLVEAIRAVAKDMNTKFDKDGGVCNDSKKTLNEDRTTKRRVQIHCFEPSPATYNMLLSVRSKLMKSMGSNHDDGAEWHIHNIGLHDHDGEMSWHAACANTVGDELCTIVPDETDGAIRVPVVTVDKFLSKFETDDGTLPLVHMLKIDAEGLDPAVLAGSSSLLTQSNAVMVMFEFNPGLSEKENPHGMWGAGGNPPKKLLEVTTWLDELGYDCYLDSRLVDKREREKGVPDDAPALYRITGNCLVDEPKVRGWANVVCASRKFGNVASRLKSYSLIR
jgi:FkbM family methyltransferase